MKRHVFRFTFSVLAILLLGMGILAIIMLYPLYKPMPALDFPTPKDPAEANRQDLTYLKQLATMDRSFTAATRTAFLQEVDRLMAQAVTLDRAALEMGVAKAVALADNGHTTAYGIAFGRNLNAIPLRFGWFQEGLFIVKADPAYQTLLGAKVLRLGGRTPAELIYALRPYISGTNAFAREFMPYVLISPPALHAIDLLPSPHEVKLSLQLRNGRTLERVIATGAQPAISADERRQPKYDLSPVSQPKDGWAGVHLLDKMAVLPPFLRHLDRKYWWMALDDPPIFYVQINSVTNESDAPSLAQFLQEVLDTVAQQRPRYVAVDLRFNSGGNYERIVHFTEVLPTMLPVNGKVFILTSGTTFSAAIITAARLKYFAGAQAEIVGEPVGDRGQHWGEGGAFTLPNSGTVIRYATGYHDWEYGCRLRDVHKCFFLNYLFGVPAGSLAPTIPAPLSYEEYIIGEDSGFNAIKNVIHSAKL